MKPYGLKLRCHEWRKHDPQYIRRRYRYHTRKECGRRAVEKTEAMSEIEAQVFSDSYTVRVTA